jgi:hypothetical protein
MDSSTDPVLPPGLGPVGRPSSCWAAGSARCDRLGRRAPLDRHTRWSMASESSRNSPLRWFAQTVRRRVRASLLPMLWGTKGLAVYVARSEAAERPDLPWRRAIRSAGCFAKPANQARSAWSGRNWN